MEKKMPRIFDNIETRLLPALCETLQISEHSDFCVGYFNLRGWKALDSYIERWAGGEGQCCRLLVGMQRLPQEEVQALFGLSKEGMEVDQGTVVRLKKELVERFRDQLTIGAPTNEDETGLRKLADQIRKKKVVIKLFLRHPLHAKLYLLFRPDPNTPIVGFLGSRKYESGEIHYEEYYPQMAKDIIDKIDCVLANHYSFTTEELDYIINYDFKYRMGKESDEEWDN
jgi:hypothetical protein